MSTESVRLSDHSDSMFFYRATGPSRRSNGIQRNLIFLHLSRRWYSWVLGTDPTRRTEHYANCAKHWIPNRPMMNLTKSVHPVRREHISSSSKELKATNPLMSVRMVEWSLHICVKKMEHPLCHASLTHIRTCIYQDLQSLHSGRQARWAKHTPGLHKLSASSNKIVLYGNDITSGPKHPMLSHTSENPWGRIPQCTSW